MRSDSDQPTTMRVLAYFALIGTLVSLALPGLWLYQFQTEWCISGSWNGAPVWPLYASYENELTLDGMLNRPLMERWTETRVIRKDIHMFTQETLADSYGTAGWGARKASHPCELKEQIREGSE